MMLPKIVKDILKKYLLKPVVNTGILRKWFYNRCCSSELKKLGYKEVKKMFIQKRRYHKAILKESDPKKRTALAIQHYNNIFNNVIENPPEKKCNFGFTADLIEKQKDLFRDKIVVDIGCGRGASTEHISRYAKQVYGVDCSSVIINDAKKEYGHLANIQFIPVEDINLSFEEESIDVVYSNDVIEHLHPDDTIMHFQEVRRVLKKGGKYFFWTPSSNTGPHDFTRNFCPKGFGIKPQASHIKEYDIGELMVILKQTEYSRAEIPDMTKQVLLIAEK